MNAHACARSCSSRHNHCFVTAIISVAVLAQCQYRRCSVGCRTTIMAFFWAGEDDELASQPAVSRSAKAANRKAPPKMTAAKKTRAATARKRQRKEGSAPSTTAPASSALYDGDSFTAVETVEGGPTRKLSTTATPSPAKRRTKSSMWDVSYASDRCLRCKRLATLFGTVGRAKSTPVVSAFSSTRTASQTSSSRTSGIATTRCSPMMWTFSRRHPHALHGHVVASGKGYVATEASSGTTLSPRSRA